MKCWGGSYVVNVCVLRDGQLSGSLACLVVNVEQFQNCFLPLDYCLAASNATPRAPTQAFPTNVLGQARVTPHTMSTAQCHAPNSASNP
jgi:hypothetical protein